jgi:HemY protein
MRFITWLVVLALVAVVAASSLGTNNGLVSMHWHYWRLDLSLNLFLILWVFTLLAAVSLVRAIIALSTWPQRAREWRLQRKDRSAQSALRESLAHYFAGRFARAVKAATRALALQKETPDLQSDVEFTVLAGLLQASSLHRLQDRDARDLQLTQVLQLIQQPMAAAGSSLRSLEEGARLLAAEWALEDRKAHQTLELLNALPAGVARRTHALKLRLQASRLVKQPVDALKTARLLAKHQAISSDAAAGLLRSLAFEAIDSTLDIQQWKSVWQQLDKAERKDPIVASRAAHRSVSLGDPLVARQLLRPFWDDLSLYAEDERELLAYALVSTFQKDRTASKEPVALSADWLSKLETAAQTFPRHAAVAYALGSALVLCQLWGKAKPLLLQAANEDKLASSARRHAWLLLAELAQREGQAEQAQHFYRVSAQTP